MSKIARKLLFRSELGLKSTVVFTKFSALPDPDIANSRYLDDISAVLLLLYSNVCNILDGQTRWRQTELIANKANNQTNGPPID